MIPAPPNTQVEHEHQCHDCELVVNHPHYDEDHEDENDIYVFSGYMEPGKHQIYVYDPVTARFFKKRSVVVYPRSRDIKQKRAGARLGRKEQAELAASANLRSA